MNASAGPPSIAVIYQGKGKTARYCAQSAADLVAKSNHRFAIVMAGPGSSTPLTDALIERSALYVQPGGGELKPAYRKLKSYRGVLRSHIKNGGRYLGLCLGGYLAGSSPGFDLMPGDTNQYIVSKGATVSHEDDTVVSLSWHGSSREVYFQDGPYFDVDERLVDVQARYPNRTIASLTCGFGLGRVAVCGPHPEASPDWFEDIRPSKPFIDASDLGLDLIDALMR